MYSLVLLLKAAVVLAVVNFCVPGAEKSELTIYDVGTARDGLRYYTFFCVAVCEGAGASPCGRGTGSNSQLTFHTHPFLGLSGAAAVETIRHALFERTANV